MVHEFLQRCVQELVVVSFSATVVLLAEKIVCGTEKAEKGCGVLAVPFMVEVPASSCMEVAVPVYGELCCRWTVETPQDRAFDLGER